MNKHHQANNKDCAVMLGITQATLINYKKNGAPKYIELACIAILLGQKSYREFMNLQID